MIQNGSRRSISDDSERLVLTGRVWLFVKLHPAWHQFAFGTSTEDGLSSLLGQLLNTTRSCTG